MIDIAHLAARQLRDYDAGNPGTMFAEDFSLSLEQAYAIQAEVARLRALRGERVVGYKLGCTSPAVRQQLGIDHSVFGRLFSTECHHSGITLSANQFANLAIEGELAVRLSRAAPTDGDDPDRILDCVGAVFPVIELHNHLLRSPRQAAAEVVANNALNAGIVAPPSDFDRPASDDLTLHVAINGETAAEVIYTPWRDAVIDAIAQLNSLLGQHGLSLQPGQIVLTGSLAALFPITGEAAVKVEARNNGRVTARFECATPIE